jgi:hypothetical protein
MICLLLAAVGVVPPRGGNLIAAGLTLWAFATIVSV